MQFLMCSSSLFYFHLKFLIFFSPKNQTQEVKNKTYFITYLCTPVWHQEGQPRSQFCLWESVGRLEHSSGSLEAPCWDPGFD